MEPSPAPRVTLIGSTVDTFTPAGKRPSPLRAIAAVWEQSKTTKSLDEVLESVDEMSEADLEKLLISVMEGVPVVECVSFIFVLENVSISWREQMVRHRVGTKPDIRVGADWLTVDSIPEVADMSAWSQSMRLMDMADFADRRAYRTPDSIISLARDKTRATPFEPVEEWHEDMARIQKMYAKWAGFGIPLEDARDLIPLGATSRLSWTVNLRTLQHIVGKRGCTILQLGLWGPIILGMISELTKKVSPVFGRLVTPPCMKGDKWSGCIFPEDIARRMDGRDHNLPVCPLFIGRDRSPLGDEARRLWAAGTLRLRPEVVAEAGRRAQFWQRNPWTGEPLRDARTPSEWLDMFESHNLGER